MHSSRLLLIPLYLFVYYLLMYFHCYLNSLISYVNVIKHAVNGCERGVFILAESYLLPALVELLRCIHGLLSLGLNCAAVL